MSVEIPVTSPGADETERSLSAIDARIEGVRQGQRELARSAERASRSMNAFAQSNNEVEGELADVGDQANDATTDIDRFVASLEDVDGRGIIQVAGSVERVQDALQNTNADANEVANRLGAGGVFAQAQNEADDLANALQNRLGNIIPNLFDSGGDSPLGDLIDDVQGAAGTLRSAFQGIDTQVLTDITAGGGGQGGGGLGTLGVAAVNALALAFKDLVDSARSANLKEALQFRPIQQQAIALRKEIERVKEARQKAQRNAGLPFVDTEKAQREVEELTDKLDDLKNKKRIVDNQLSSDELEAVEDAAADVGGSASAASGAFGTLSTAFAAAKGAGKRFLGTIASLIARIPVVGQVLLAVGTLIGGAFVAGLALATRKAAQFAQELRVAQSQTRITGEQIQETFLIAQRLDSEVDLDTIRDSFKEFGIRVREAREGTGEAAEAFKDLGISQRELAESSPQQLYDRTIESLRGLSKESRIYRAEQVLGAEAAERLTRVLNLTEEQYGDLKEEVAGQLLSPQVVDQLDAAEAAFKGQEQAVNTASQRLSAEYLPVLVKLNRLWTSIRIAVFDALAAVGRFALPDLEEIDERAGGGRESEIARSGGEGPDITIAQDLEDANEALAAGIIDEEELLQRRIRAYQQYFDDLQELGAPQEALNTVGSVISRLRAELSNMQTPEPGVPVVTPEDRLIEQGEVNFDQALDLEARDTSLSDFDELLQNLAATRQFFDGIERQRRVVSSLERLILATLRGETDVTQFQLRMLREMTKEERERLEVAERKLAFDREREELLRNIESRLTGVVGSFYDSLIDGTQNFGDALEQAGKQALRDIVTGTAAAAFRRLLQGDDDRQIDIFDVLGGGGQQDQSESLVQGIAGIGGNQQTQGSGRAGLGAALGSGAGQGVQQATGSQVAGAAVGAGTAALIAATGGAGIPLIALSGLLGGFGGFFASGGRPPQGKVSVVGEQGPELFIPDAAGTIVPNQALQPNMPSIPNQTIDTEAITKAVEKATVQTVISRRASRDILETGERERDKVKRR